MVSYAQLTSTRGPDDADPFTAYTNSGGEASVYFELVGATGIVDVEVGVTGTTADATFQPEVEDTTRRPTLAILSGNNQRTDENGDIDDDLVVVVRKDGPLFPGESVTFKAKNGYLENGARSIKQKQLMLTEKPKSSTTKSLVQVVIQLPQGSVVRQVRHLHMR